MMLLKQSTAVTIQMGPAVDATDGVTAETGLTPTVYVAKNGGAQAARNSASAIAHDRDGYYTVPLSTTDTNTLGTLLVQFSAAATHVPVWAEYMVLPANVYDSLVAGSDTLDVAATSVAVGAMDAAALATDAVNEIADGVWDEATAGHAGAGSAGAALTDKADYTLAASAVDSIWDEEVDGTVTARQGLRGMFSAMLAKLSGAATTTVKIRDLGDSKDRVTATVDGSGNRSAVTLDLS